MTIILTFAKPMQTLRKAISDPQMGTKHATFCSFWWPVRRIPRWRAGRQVQYMCYRSESPNMLIIWTNEINVTMCFLEPWLNHERYEDVNPWPTLKKRFLNAKGGSHWITLLSYCDRKTGSKYVYMDLSSPSDGRRLNGYCVSLVFRFRVWSPYIYIPD